MTPAIVEALARVERALAELRAAIGTDAAPVALGEDDWPLEPGHPDLVTTAVAAERAGRSPDTLRSWARERGIGRSYGGRIFISIKRLQKTMAEL